MKNNPLITAYGTQKRFVAWKLETRKGKTTKLPYQINGKLASSTNPATWATFEQVKKHTSKVGIVLNDGLLLVIDLDHVIEGGKLAHKDKKRLRALIEQADTFTELSQSKHGLHVYLALTEPFKLTANKREPVEAYVSGRYIATTGESFGKVKPIRTIPPSEAIQLLELAGLSQNDPFSEENEVKSVPPLSTKYLEPIPDEELLERMFGASNGADIKALYDGDASRYGRDLSKADMALLAHLAFWTNKNAEQMERLWLSSPLGKREKTQERDDYRKRTIKAAIINCAEGFVPWDRTPEALELDLLSTGKGKTKKYPMNTENICRILRRHAEFKGTLRYDSYRAVAERKLSDGSWRAIVDVDAIDVQTRVSILFPQFTMVGKNMAWDALMKVVEENTYDSGIDFLRSLVWDKQPRLDTWIPSVYHTPADDLHAAIGSNWVKGMVKRIIEPGCKFDYVLVLEGAQGIGKSKSLAILAGALGHVETTMSTDTKDFFLQFIGNAIVEFSEGETLSRTETKRLKAIITVQNDKFRPPYGRTSVDNPRRCVFAMTTNQDEYLKDETGNRRWLPVAVVGAIDEAWLRDNRNQLLAEAYHRVVTLKETTYDFPVDDIAAAQQQRRIHDPNEERIMHWYFNILSESQRNLGITVSQVYQDCLNALSRPITRGEEMGIADVLKSSLAMERRRAMVGYVRVWRWYPTEKTTTMLPLISETLEF